MTWVSEVWLAKLDAATMMIWRVPDSRAWFTMASQRCEACSVVGGATVTVSRPRLVEAAEAE